MYLQPLQPRPLFSPRSVAILRRLGRPRPASRRGTVRYLIEGGFAGGIYPDQSETAKEKKKKNPVGPKD